MKSGIDDRPKFIAAVTLTAVALLVAGRWIVGTTAAVAGASTCVDRPQSDSSERLRVTKLGTANSLDPTLHFAQLEFVEHEPYTGTGRNIFRDVEQAARKSGHDAQDPTPIKGDPQLPPSIRLRFFGFATIMTSPRKVFLRNDDSLFIATEGEVIDRRYRVGRIGSDSVEIEDLIEHRQQTLVLPPG